MTDPTLQAASAHRVVIFTNWNHPMPDPASIRFNNPGAMWGGAFASRWGATQTVALNDGLGQGNTIADFPTKVQGAAAQFDLWKTKYCNMPLIAAVTKWSGGNSSPAYLAFLASRGFASTMVVTPMFLASEQGWKLMQAQAQWEAGKPYPMSDAEWKAAQNLCFGKGIYPPNATIPSKVHKKTGGAIIVATGGAAAGAAHQAGLPAWAIILIALAMAAFAAFMIWKFKS